MECPVDGTTLTIADRSGVEIDYCPQCRGVWLDRGELDKIIDRAASEPGPPPSREYRGRDDDDRYRGVYRERRDDDDDRYYRGGYRKKKRSWLSDMFKFDD